MIILYRVIRCGARLLAINLTWLAVVGAGTGFFLAPWGAEGQPLSHDLMSFGCSLAIATVVSAAVTLLISGERSWAAEVVLAIALTIAASVVTLYVLLWIEPMILRSQMDAWSFLRLRAHARIWGEQALLFELPFSAGVGAVVGLLGGLMIRSAGWSTQLSRWLGLGLLLACAASSTQGLVSTFLVGWGWMVHMLISSPWLTAIEVSATGAAIGSIAGTVVAGLATHVARQTRRAVTAAGLSGATVFETSVQ